MIKNENGLTPAVRRRNEHALTPAMWDRLVQQVGLTREEQRSLVRCSGYSEIARAANRNDFAEVRRLLQVYYIRSKA